MATSVAGPLVEMCSTPTYVAPGREYKIYVYIQILNSLVSTLAGRLVENHRP